MLTQSLVELLRSGPISARQIVSQLALDGHDVDKSRVNSVLYRRADLFQHDGSIPPRWSLVEAEVLERARTPYRVSGVGLENWKSFSREVTVFQDITLVYGENSSGKSSLFQSMLLLKQSWPTGSLQMNGAWGDFGWYQHVVHGHDLDLDMTLSLFWGSRGSVDDWGLMVRIPHGPADFAFDSTHPIEAIYCQSPTEAVALLSVAALPREIASGAADGWMALRGDDIADLARGSDGEFPGMRDSIFLFDDDPLGFPDLEHPIRSQPPNGAGALRPEAETLQAIQSTFARAALMLDSLEYIGPSRTVPSRDITLSWARDNAEYLARLYERDELLTDVNEWMARFEVPYVVELTPYGEDDGDPVFELNLVRSGAAGESVQLRDVGFGVSQLLPIIVTLLGSREKTILIEEPEAHIHPRLQSTIGDLLLTSAQDYGNVLIVETHSEPILLRLQRRIAEGRVSSDDVGVLHVTREGSTSQITAVSIEEDGRLEYQWPGGFFDDRMDDLVAILDPRPEE